MNKIMLLTLSVLFLGCASGHCRDQEKLKKETQTKIKVYKYDGTLQCGMGKTISLEEMQKEFGAIKVYSSKNIVDGLMHIQMCGSPTGKSNVYEIDKADLEQALKLGFKEWSFE